jgi:uncharacterized protein (DUF2236 family)
MMELAHPLVAAGIARHSNFRRDGFGRLYRTLRAANDLTFGDVRAARQAARHIQRCHAPVAGRLQERVGSLPEGTSYYADDPHLKFWVLATLIDSTLLVYGMFIRPLATDEKEAYYRDSQVLARLLGINASVIPPTFHDFGGYMHRMLAGDSLTVNDSARQIVRALFAPPLLGGLARAASFAGIGLLPESIRAGYGFRWGEKREKLLQRLAAVSRRVRPITPSLFCVNGRALLAEYGFRSPWPSAKLGHSRPYSR